MARLVEVKPLDDYRIFVKYSDGLEGELNMKKMIERDEYKSLADPRKFMKVFIDNKTKDITWETGASVCKVAAHNMLLLKKEMEGMGLDVGKND